MKLLSIRILLLMGVISFQMTCEDQSRKLGNGEQEHQSLEKSPMAKDSKNYDSSCENKKYTATLYNLKLKPDPFLTVKYDNEVTQEDTIKLTGFETEMIQIDWCTDEYIVLESPCGGPCYGNTFIFLDQDRKVENYRYCQQVENSENLIIYRQNEEFEIVRIRNLANGKELIVEIDYCDDKDWICLTEKAYIEDKNLILEYDLLSKRPKKRIISIGELL